MTGVSAVEVSENRKLGKVSATYVAQQSCPKSCPFYKSGCYAESGMVGCQTARLNRDAAELTSYQLAQNEAQAIDVLPGELPLRLHVVGDCRTSRAARVVSSAAVRYRSKHGRPVWTYTHAWRKVVRSAWRSVSVLASCETAAQVRQAWRREYACAMVVAEHASDKAYFLENLKVVPCPQQTGRVSSCADCKLCFDDARLREIGVVIAFEAHGATNIVKSKLVQIGRRP